MCILYGKVEGHFVYFSDSTCFKRMYINQCEVRNVTEYFMRNKC